MIKELQQKANEVRKQVLENCFKYNNPHLSSCLSCVDILTVLYYGNFIQRPKSKFILSKGHANETLSTILEMMHVPGVMHSDHPEYGNPGVECTSGSLGQGLGIACGIALANKINKSEEMVYCLVGDGELMEGLSMEAIHSIYDLKLPIKVLIDGNWYATERQPSSLFFGTVFKTPYHGHDIETICRSLQTDEKVIVYETVKGYGLHNIHDERLVNWDMIHYLKADANNIEIFREELNNFIENWEKF
jgi:transketolase